MCVYLCSTQANVELVIVLGSLGSETRSIHDGPHWVQSTEVVGQCMVLIHMGEGAVVETQRVLLHKENKHTFTYRMFLYLYLLCGLTHTHLTALTARATRLAGLLSIDVMSREEGVWRTLLTLVGFFVYEVSSRAGDAGRSALLAHHGAGMAR